MASGAQASQGVRGRSRVPDASARQPSGPARCPGHRRLVPAARTRAPCPARTRATPTLAMPAWRRAGPHRSLPSHAPRPPRPSGALAPAEPLRPADRRRPARRARSPAEARPRNHRLRIVLAALLSLALVASAVWFVANRGRRPQAPTAPVATGPDQPSCCRSSRAHGAAWRCSPRRPPAPAGRRGPRCPTSSWSRSGGFGGDDPGGGRGRCPSRRRRRRARGQPGHRGRRDLDARREGLSPPWSTPRRRHRRRRHRHRRARATGRGHPVPPGSSTWTAPRPRRTRRTSAPASPSRAGSPGSTPSSAVLGRPAGRPGQVTLTLGTLGASSVQHAARAARGPSWRTCARRRSVRRVVYRTLPVRDLDAGAGGRDATTWTPPALPTRSATSGSAAGARRARAASASSSRTASAPRGSGNGTRPARQGRASPTSPAATPRPFDNARAVVLITDATAEKRAQGEAVAKALGLPASRAAGHVAGPEHRRRRGRPGQGLQALTVRDRETPARGPVRRPDVDPVGARSPSKAWS